VAWVPKLLTIEAMHFLTEYDYDKETMLGVMQKARALRNSRRTHSPADAMVNDLAGQSWGLLFFKASTRTRVSFEVGIRELGGHAVVLNQSSTQLSRGETPEDTARVLSRYLHGLIIRCHEHSLLEAFAQAGSIPIVNALSDDLHPCQSYADLLTMAGILNPGDNSGDFEVLKGRKLVFFGDTDCNVARSLVLAGSRFGMEVVLSGPDKYNPSASLADYRDEGKPVRFSFEADPHKAVKGADFVYTDVWVSMGKEEEKAARLEEFRPWQINRSLLEKAAPKVRVLHCLPAHPGEEITGDVFQQHADILWDQAENRLHLQKALLLHLNALKST